MGEEEFVHWLHPGLFIAKRAHIGETLQGLRDKRQGSLRTRTWMVYETKLVSAQLRIRY